MTRPYRPARRALLGAGAALVLRPVAAAEPAQGREALRKPIPSSGELLPVIGLGTWITFNVGADPAARAGRTEVVRAFFDEGGGMIDSSPMYGSSQAVLGDALARLGHPPGLFAADKVWTASAARGPVQVEASRALWGVPRFDLLQVHNMLAWEAQLELLQVMKADGRLRYVGITTSEGRRHREVEAVMAAHRIDFVQVSYNLLDREVEQRILPLARERGIAVIANRPFRQGALLQALARHPLPGWAAGIGCAHWAQVALKFVVSHPNVSCAIPATSRVEHLRQNMAAGRGAMPDAALRRRMAAEVQAL